MLPTIETIVLPGGRIEISSPELIPGQKAKVWIVLEPAPAEKRALSEILGDYPGGRLFKRLKKWMRTSVRNATRGNAKPAGTGSRHRRWCFDFG
jgi:hypothetical protein